MGRRASTVRAAAARHRPRREPGARRRVEDGLWAEVTAVPLDAAGRRLLGLPIAQLGLAGDGRRSSRLARRRRPAAVERLSLPCARGAPTAPRRRRTGSACRRASGAPRATVGTRTSGALDSAGAGREIRSTARRLRSGRSVAVSCDVDPSDESWFIAVDSRAPDRRALRRRSGQLVAPRRALLEEVLPAREQRLESLAARLVRGERVDVRPVLGEPALELGDLGSRARRSRPRAARARAGGAARASAWRGLLLALGLRRRARRGGASSLARRT